ncbi:MAG: HNH endonuclease [Gemmatimonadetes bacterium]|nr:HNH endonuclease [Gemmatimonadota bacterium]MYG84374.1 HNH endonuclease [Gemmatimonadota bacterium]MYJ88249.1 HNH endonuclease [Gemmatimonadota bacterium]
MNVEGSGFKMRMTAFDHVRRLSEAHGHLTRSQLNQGFLFEGKRIPLVNPQRGIFKPRQMRFLLSITTVVPKSGGRIKYDDQRTLVHRRIFEGEETLDYAFMGQNPESAENQWLKEAWKNRIPVIYFLGVSPGLYQAIVPTFISGWDGSALKSSLIIGNPYQEGFEEPINAKERRYALRLVKERLHQDTFRDAVLHAYRGRCAITGLPETQLLDAAHIIADGDETFGQPIVPNGLALSKIHHAAFDAHLIGIDPNYRLHVSERLLEKKDGPMLQALKQLDGSGLHLPSRTIDHPDPERLERRFETFRKAG